SEFIMGILSQAGGGLPSLAAVRRKTIVDRHRSGLLKLQTCLAAAATLQISSAPMPPRRRSTMRRGRPLHSAFAHALGRLARASATHFFLDAGADFGIDAL